MNGIEQMERFARRYGETWDAWDAEGFLSLFHDDIVYVAHPDEVVRGIDELARYVQKEQADQGTLQVRMGRPVVQGTRVVAEFWATSVGQDSPWTCPGCLIADIDPADGRCRRFREYLFEHEGAHEPFPGWGIYDQRTAIAPSTPGSGRPAASASTAARKTRDGRPQSSAVTVSCARRQIPRISPSRRIAPGQTRGVQSSPRRRASGTRRVRSAPCRRV